MADRAVLPPPSASRANLCHTSRCRALPSEPPKDHSGVIAKRKAIEHAGCSLCATVARNRTEARERNCFQPTKFFGGGLNKQTDLPMTGVIGERDGFAIGRAASALGAKDEKLFAPDFGGIPAHACVLRHAEQIATGTVQQHFFGNGQTSRRATRACLNLVNLRRRGIKHVVAGTHPFIETGLAPMEKKTASSFARD